ncbi:MAG: hypothetical protein EOO63_07235 [Hymenobacter sp.]|nr:MAG: hypothetical protein EOO63_07235 [Hymenobacter sp.]
MAKNGIDHVMAASATVGAGKGVVGEPKHMPGYTGVAIRAAIFFDGTKNNRTNTRKRLNNPHIMQVKDGESSYANSLSNVAIMEVLNNRREVAEREVSVYVEGIGTQDFEEGGLKRDSKGQPLKDKNGHPIRLTDKENGNDAGVGYAVGSGPTGITSKVIKGIRLLRSEIAKAYKPGKKGREYIKKIIVDVAGFSRGAAAARHFVSKREALLSGWLDQDAPIVEINFVGLYDTVSSFESVKGGIGEAGMYLASLGWVPGPMGIPLPTNPHAFSTDNIFGDDVLQLGLNLGNVPKRVIHLTAQDEYRENFSLTNINTSLKAHIGLEVSLPGAHSDIGGGYTEGDPKNPTREMNKETRRIKNAAEKQQLIHDGWYRPNQFKPWRKYNVPVPLGVLSPLLPLPPIVRVPVSIWEDGVRYLTHEYQFVALYIMLDFATHADKPGQLPMSFASLTGNNARYQVPADLVAIRNHFNSEAHRLNGQMGKPRKKGDKQIASITCQTTLETHRLRNKYLHRSARLFSEFKVGMAGRIDAGRDTHYRFIIPDDVPVEKTQDAVIREGKEKLNETKASVRSRLDQLREQKNRALHLLKEGAKRGLEELGKHPPMYPPF